MGLKQDLEAVRDTVGAALHNVNTALAERGVPTVGTLAALPDALETIHGLGVADGVRTAHDAFWDVYQKNGERDNYANAFSGVGWTEQTFTPKHDILPCGSAQNLFSNCAFADLPQRLLDAGVTLNTEGATDLNCAFSGAIIEAVPEISTVGCDRLYAVFNSCHRLRSIEKLVLRSDGSQRFDDCFTLCSALTDITVEGVIGANWYIHWSPLSRESIESVLAALSDTATGQTVTFSKAAVNKAFETAEGANDGAGSMDWEIWTWEKPNWTITLA